MRGRSLVLFGALGLACVGTPAIPEDAAVQCKGDSDCPNGYTCRETIGRCVPVGSVDVLITSLTLAVIEGVVAGPMSTLELSSAA